MDLRIVFIGMLLVMTVPIAYADRIIAAPNFSSNYNIYKPHTREEIYGSYRALVEKRDGITKLEAQLIAQFEAVMQDLDSGYDVSKPRVVKETSGEWTVRFPSKFSLIERRRPKDWTFVIDKDNGQVITSSESKDDMLP